jgi:hypothetical protein
MDEIEITNVVLDLVLSSVFSVYLYILDRNEVIIWIVSVCELNNFILEIMEFFN